MREYKLHKLRLMSLARLLYGKKIELVIDGTIVDIDNVNRARTQTVSYTHLTLPTNSLV